MNQTMLTVNADEAKIPELLNATADGQMILITRQDTPVAILSPIAINQPVLEEAKKRQRRLGTATGLFTMSDDFDEPLEEFKGYQ
ncbi:MAG: type II toxin-antitoxin system prevent-host-death family antitoxin [Candidatus Parabeggiatoa sp. nov. 3]|jgi:antitoxin (DNA-binding transcriptional repressor) of toxin-antitoxin stability system|nr:MAG: type II toxin-antitoxin system prevent-host-death family antitoxin [Gammaproteobacteria bacterium]RKZ56087.1 MAG: type II toxin-antitoxin system prevent-host-death family antitoxin [Gammaproteobacteria bacterium]